MLLPEKVGVPLCFPVIKRPCFERQIHTIRRYTNVVGCSVKILHLELFPGGPCAVHSVGFVQAGTPNGHGMVFFPSCCKFHCFCSLKGLFLPCGTSAVCLQHADVALSVCTLYPLGAHICGGP